MKKLTDIQGVGPKRAELLGKLGIETFDDLIRYFPRTYEDRTKVVLLSDAPMGENVTIKARVFSGVKETRIRKNMTIYSMIINDDSDAMNIIWYNNRFVKNAFSEGKEYYFYGKIVINRGKREMINPIYESVDKQKATGRIVPVYPLCEGLNQKVVRDTVENALSDMGVLKEYMPQKIRKQYNLCEVNFAYHNIHFPENSKSYEIARRRFVFEELFMLRLALMLRKGTNTIREREPYKFTDTSAFLNSLPFEMTDSQKKVLSEITDNLKSKKAMSRLVQGDVGSGKTAVAAACMYLSAKNGYQSVMMAPTEILANQHYKSFTEMFEPFGMKVALLTSSSKNKKDILSKIESGEVDIIVGTHAVIQKDVKFRNLALAITDEQHRFGVGQRADLIEKGENVNVLVMTATPIPRTLALILYGDLDISVIDTLPPGRKPVKTYAVGENMRDRIYAFLEKNIKEGMQGYVVCPLVKETEKSDLEDAENLYKKIQRTYPKMRVGIVHGKMKSADKNEVMKAFSEGEIDVLVSTTVIEVGVNAPNSNIMIIENAERFGLSQLHQLRGRVGRGDKQAYCILFAHGKNEVTVKRMETMCKSNDGFYISEQDLKIRGPGDFFGTRQHGLPELKVANLFTDIDLLQMAQDAANDLMSEDRKRLNEEYDELFKKAGNIISQKSVMN